MNPVPLVFVPLIAVNRAANIAHARELLAVPLCSCSSWDTLGLFF
jgi:hypothetical protein